MHRPARLQYNMNQRIIKIHVCSVLGHVSAFGRAWKTIWMYQHYIKIGLLSIAPFPRTVILVYRDAGHNYKESKDCNVDKDGEDNDGNCCSMFAFVSLPHNVSSVLCVHRTALP